MNTTEIIRVGQVMTRNVITIESTKSVRDAMRLMRQKETSSLIIERRDAEDECGIIVVTDIAREVLGKRHSPDRVNVYEIMSKPVVTLPEEMNIVFAMRMLTNFNMSRALVVDHDRNPLGLVTLRDMVLRSLDEE